MYNVFGVQGSAETEVHDVSTGKKPALRTEQQAKTPNHQNIIFC